MPSSVRAASATSAGPLAVGDPRLGAVEHVLVAVAHGPARDVAGVAARRRARTATAQPRRSPGRHGGQPPLLLLVGAVRHDQRRRHRVGVDDAGQAHPAVGQLLDDADVGQQVEAEAAVLLGDGDAEQAELAHLPSTISVGELVRALELGRDRDDLARRRSAGRCR